MKGEVYHKAFESAVDNISHARAVIKGNSTNPGLSGIADFYAVGEGVIVNIEVEGLPDDGFYGLHIHEMGDCTPPFDKTGMHYNPTMQPHPQHVGDMPPLLGNNGYAWSAFFTSRFNLKAVVGRAIVIHNMPDDFKTEPSGDSGEKIGCGVIIMQSA